MLFSLVSSRQVSIFSTIGCSSRIWARTRASVEKPVLPRRLRVRPSSSKRTSADLLRRADRELLARPARRSRVSSWSIRSPKPGADLGQPLGVELQPLPLHRRQHLDQRQLDLAQQRAPGPAPRAAAAGRRRASATRRASSAGLEARLGLLAERELAVVLVVLRGRRPRRGRCRRRRRARPGRRCGAAARAGRRRASCRGRASSSTPSRAAAASSPWRPPPSDFSVVAGERPAAERDRELVVGRRRR